MTYYRLTWNFVYFDGKIGRLVLTRSATNADYLSSLEESKTIMRQNILINNNNIEIPANLITETLEFITLTQFNNLVKGPDDLEIIEPINTNENENN